MELQSFFAICLVCLIPAVTGHGYMSKPASRNAMWRYGFKNPVNHDDNGLNCGGFSFQWDTNKGKCGVCGDPFGGKQRHVYPGKYANGINAATYKQGQVIDIEFEITAQHQGWIEFRLGDIGARPITQAKLIYTLPVVGLYGFGTRYYFPPKSGRGKFKTKVKLPDDLSCNNCVLQWWWKVGNSWGCDKSGCGIGRGNQETFVNCADIKIDASSVVSTQQPVSGTQPSPVPNTKRPATQQPVTKTKQLETKSQRSSTATQQPVTRTTGPKAVTQKTSTSFQEPITKTSGPETTSEKPATGTKEPATGDCKAVGIWKKVKGMDKWCKWNCPAFCPRSHCQCGTMPPAKNCRAVGRYKAVRGMTEWCNENCPACPSSHCACE